MPRVGTDFTSTIDEFADLRNEAAELRVMVDKLMPLQDMLIGEGVINNTGKRLTIDKTIHLSDICNNITSLEERLEALENVEEELINTVVGQTPGSEAVSTDSIQILPGVTGRKSLSLTNIGTADVYWSMDVAAVENKGNLLSANGGTILLDRTVITDGPVFGIAGSGTNIVMFQEGL